MLYEWRSLNLRQRAAIAHLQREYEAAWVPVLEALTASGQLKADVELARLLIFGALNWSVQWYNPAQAAQRWTTHGRGDDALHCTRNAT